MGKVYARLILQTLVENENYIQGMIRVHHSEIVPIIDDTFMNRQENTP